ncbi:MAG: trypsin-like peptidase domain-containing protein [Xanthomonadaceae bacterium]|nr:trypsin-like peptidase domain-containing protein [Xanthomonadaceae bacterium]
MESMTFGARLAGAARRVRPLAGMLALLGAIGCTHAASLDARRLPQIQSATFEVVAAKPVNDTLKYERPLPLDLLPYQERTDKYESIGTAFALGRNRYVTAAHVLMTGVNSLWGPPALRDSKGHVYPIGKVLKFSMEKDFVEFSLAQPTGRPGLEVNRHPAIDSVVFAVGNALGTGVVARDGLYTSDSDEEQDGRWKWMRFSAAASPGNSGGPLLDDAGRVIGVVLAKSPNENLNYALPIGMVLDAPEGVAEADRRIAYQLAVFDTRISHRFQTRFSLPLGLEDFYAQYRTRWNAWCDSQLAALLAKEPERLFPRGEGSEQLLHDLPTMTDFPSLIIRKSNGQWGLSDNSGHTIKLASNGYMEGGVVGGYILFHLRRPDTVDGNDLYDQPEVLSKLIADTGILQRRVGTESVRITSLGTPDLNDVHVDAWGRRWQTREWALPYANLRLMVLALPVPDGYVGMMRFIPSSARHDFLISMQALTDFIYATYDGTFAQWDAFMKRKDLLPRALGNVRLDFSYGKRFGYASDRLRLAFPAKVQKVEPDSMLTLGMGFFPEGKAVTWDVEDVWTAARDNVNDTINVQRRIAPTASMDDSFRTSWERVVGRKHPFDRIPRSENDVSKIDAVVGPAASVLYTVDYHAEGARSPDFMSAGLKSLLGGLQVLEKPEAPRDAGKLATTRR